MDIRSHAIFDRAGHSCLHQMTTPDIRAHFKLPPRTFVLTSNYHPGHSCSYQLHLSVGTNVRDSFIVVQHLEGLRYLHGYACDGGGRETVVDVCQLDEATVLLLARLRHVHGAAQQRGHSVVRPLRHIGRGSYGHHVHQLHLTPRDGQQAANTTTSHNVHYVHTLK